MWWVARVDVIRQMTFLDRAALEAALEMRFRLVIC